MKFAVRAILFYSVSLLIAFVVCGIANAAIYAVTTYWGFNDFGFPALLFWLAIALLETSCCLYAVSSVNEDILWPIEETERPTTVTKDEGT